MAVINKEKLNEMAEKLKAEADRIQDGDVKTYLKHRQISIKMWEMLAYMGGSAIIGLLIGLAI